MQSLYKQTVLITGSSRGIGAETAVAFAKQGCNVFITFINELSQADEVRKKCIDAGASDVEIIELDVKDDQSIKDAVKTISLSHGGLDILVNNAGVIRWKKFQSQTDEDIEDQIFTNLMGTIKMTKYALPHVRDTIINIASGAGSHAVVDLSVYCATKSAVRAFSEVLAIENPGLNVYTVSPSATSTDSSNYRGMPPEKVAEVIVNTAIDGCGKESGSDIKVLEAISEKHRVTPW